MKFDCLLNIQRNVVFTELLKNSRTRQNNLANKQCEPNYLDITITNCIQVLKYFNSFKITLNFPIYFAYKEYTLHDGIRIYLFYLFLKGIHALLY